MTPLNIEDLERLLAEANETAEWLAAECGPDTPPLTDFKDQPTHDMVIAHGAVMLDKLGAQLLAAAREGEEAKDELQYQLKDAFVAGCCAVLTWTHSGMPQDDLDEAGYDYATTFLAHQALHPTPREGTL